MGTDPDRQEATDDRLAVHLSWPMGPPAPRRKFGRRATDRVGLQLAEGGGTPSPGQAPPGVAPAEVAHVLAELVAARAELSELRGEMVSLRKEMASLRRRIPLKA